MNVQVLFFARLKELLGESRRVFVPEGSTLHELVRMLSHESEDLLLNKIPLVYAVNEEFADGSQVLKNADVVALMTPVSGG